jgi:hypothetical protein
MKRILLAAATIAIGVTAGTGSAANNPHSPIATPAAACETMVQYGVGGYTSFGDCVGRLHSDIAEYRFPNDEGTALISLDQRCSQFEQGLTDPETGEFFQLTYPFQFVEFPGWPFPEFWAENHQQCMITLFAYHTLASLLGE